jgi:hypothetical protein
MWRSCEIQSLELHKRYLLQGRGIWCHNKLPKSRIVLMSQFFRISKSGQSKTLCPEIRVIFTEQK